MLICVDVTLLSGIVIVFRSYQIAWLKRLISPQLLLEILENYIIASLCELKTTNDCLGVVGTEDDWQF